TEDIQEGSIIGEVPAIIAEYTLFDLDAQVKGIAAPDVTTMPSAQPINREIVVTEDKIAAEIKQLVRIWNEERNKQEIRSIEKIEEVMIQLMCFKFGEWNRREIMSIEKSVMSKFGESVNEDTITTWLVKVGEDVNEYDPIAEVMTDKVNAEIPSSYTGTIKEI